MGDAPWPARSVEYSKIEDKLKQDLDTARARHDLALAQFQRFNPPDNVDLDAPKPQSGLRRIIKREYITSVRNYRRSLKRFCDFVISGKLPGE